MRHGGAAPALVYGWYPAERDGALTMRWTTGAAAALLRLEAPASQITATWRTVRPDQDITVRVRRLDDLAVLFERSGRVGTSWITQEFPCALPSGTYELQILTAPAVVVGGGRALGAGIVGLSLA